MIHLKSRNKSGFVLMEVLLALTIVAMLSTPVFLLIRNSLVTIVRYSDSMEEIFAMENVLIEQTYKALAEDKVGVDLQTTEKAFDFVVKYSRTKIPTFKNLTAANLNNLSMQKAAITEKKKENFIISFLYRPKKNKS